jgi:large subunit ribosomal protein L4
MNKKTKRVALFSALSAKVAEGKLIVVDNIASESYKTKVMANMLAALKVDTRALIVLPEVNPFTVKSCANLARVETTLVGTLNVYEIMKADKVVIAAEAVKKLEEVYA